jgi:hypothetical protein
MDTDLLIERLSSEVRPVSSLALPIRAARGLLAGAVASALVLLGVMGLRPDLGQALTSASFWMKAGYTAALALTGIAATLRLARPEMAGTRHLRPMLAAAMALAALGLVELIRTPPAIWPSLWLGNSWALCPLRILALSGPLFLGLVWSLRRLAPTDLRSAGAAAGLASGALGALLYCLRCPESSALFVLAWYDLGILAAGALGALAGPRLLRW